ncbi:Molybdopterin molybdenumtransferase / Molybdenum cofactor cytidylyltransferase, partial [hydrothermal vent metagenome]
MKFGHLALAEAAGAILAHAHVVTIDGERRKLAKGLVLTPDHVAALAAAGLTSVVAARLDAGDVGEDDAAAQLASAAAGAGVTAMAAFTGRVNLVATRAGLVLIGASAVNGFNAIDESLTLSTLRPFEAVTVGQMLATVKIIPFGAPADAVRAGVELLSGGAVSVAAFRPRKVGLLVTLLPSLKTKLHDKTRRVLEARLRKSGSSVVAERRVAHQAEAVAAGLAG